MLLAKNAAYGDTALNPPKIFSTLSPSEAIRARLDDKLSRHMHQPGAFGEAEVDDLIGYLILLNIAERNEYNVKMDGLAAVMWPARDDPLDARAREFMSWDDSPDDEVVLVEQAAEMVKDRIKELETVLPDAPPQFGNKWLRSQIGPPTDEEGAKLKNWGLVS
jgi:hypothetical protein